MTNILLVEDDEVDVMNVKGAFKKNNITNLCVGQWVGGITHTTGQWQHAGDAARAKIDITRL